MNQWRALFQGLLPGLKSLGSGYIDYKADKNAQDILKQGKESLLNTYDALQKQQEAIFNKYVTPDLTGEQQPNDNPLLQNRSTAPPQVNNEDLSKKLFGNYSDTLTKLMQNPETAQKYAPILQDYYNTLIGKQKKYSFEKGTDGDYIFSSDGTFRKITNKEQDEKWTPFGEPYYFTDADGKRMVTYRFTDATKTKQRELTQPANDEPPNTAITGRTGRIGRVGSPTNNLTVKENQMRDALEKYDKAITNGDEKTKAKLKQNLDEMGMNIEDLYNQYSYLPDNKKKQGDFFKTAVRSSDQINEAYNQTYKDLNMDNWWSDLYNVNSEADFQNKQNYYADYLSKEVLPQVTPEVGKLIWSTFQKSLNRIYNDKRFWEQNN